MTKLAAFLEAHEGDSAGEGYAFTAPGVAVLNAYRFEVAARRRPTVTEILLQRFSAKIDGLTPSDVERVRSGFASDAGVFPNRRPMSSDEVGNWEGKQAKLAK